MRVEFRWGGPRSLLPGLATLISILGARWALFNLTLGTAGRAAVALIPTAFAGYALYAIAKGSARARDELEQRIQKEALALAVAGTLLTAWAVGWLQLAGVVGALNWILVWPVTLALYFVGLVAATKRYQ